MSPQVAQPWQVTDTISKSRNKTAKDKDQRVSMSISHDAQKRRISMRIDGAHTEAAFLEYDVIRPGVWDIKRTEVAPMHRGHGVADELVIRALETAQSNNVKVTCSCSYVSDTFMPRHPEWNQIRADLSQSDMQQAKQNEQSKANSQRMEEKLKYSDRVKKESEMDESADHEAKRPEERAAKELNKAMKQTNERGFRGYS